MTTNTKTRKACEPSVSASHSRLSRYGGKFSSPPEVETLTIPELCKLRGIETPKSVQIGGKGELIGWYQFKRLKNEVILSVGDKIEIDGNCKRCSKFPLFCKCASANEEYQPSNAYTVHAIRLVETCENCGDGTHESDMGNKQFAAVPYCDRRKDSQNPTTYKPVQMVEITTE